MKRTLALLCSLAPSLVLAEPSAKPQGPLVPTAGYLEAVSGLLLVLLLIIGLGWAIKRLGIAPVNKGVVRIVGGVSLGARERALVLEADGKRILVGVAPGQVRPLMRLDDVRSGPEASNPVAADFTRQLQQEQAMAAETSPERGQGG
jgi:flagellar protein FliO/FliZ